MREVSQHHSSTYRVSAAAQGSPWSEDLAQLLRGQAGLSKKRPQDARAQVAAMHGYCDKQIASFHAQMAALLPHFVEADTFESRDQPAWGSDGEIRQQRAP